MPEETTAPDLVQLTRQVIDAGNRRDLDAVMSLYAADVVWESLDGLGGFNGATAVRAFLGDWLSSYEVFEMEPEEVLDMGGGVTFVVGSQSGYLRGAAGRVDATFCVGLTWEHGLVVHVIAGMDIGKARAAAERLAQERG